MNAYRPARLLYAALLGSLLLGACGTAPGPVPPADVSDGCDGCMLEKGEVHISQTEATGALSRPFTGTWRVVNSPEWLQVSPARGSSNFDLTLKPRRGLNIPPAANEPQLSGNVKIVWYSPGAPNLEHELTVHVTADRFRLDGSVEVPLAQPLNVAAAADTATEAGGLSQQSAAAAKPQQVLVKYATPAVADAVAEGLQRAPLQSQSLPPRGVANAALSSQERAAVTRALQDWASLPAEAGLTAQSVSAPEVTGQAGQWLVVTVPNAAAAAQALAAGEALAATPSATLRAQALPSSVEPPVVPTDDYAPLQWAFRTLGYGSVWRDIENGGYTRPVTVAVVDTGVRYDHPDLVGALVLPGEGALDFVAEGATGRDLQSKLPQPDPDPTDPDLEPDLSPRSGNSHGTHVAGIIAARWGQNKITKPTQSRSGVVGAVYKAPVKVLPLRVLDTKGDAQTAAVTMAVRYAAGLPIVINGQTYQNPLPAQVINLSLGGPISKAEAQPMCDAVAEARKAGSLVVASSGNFYSSSAVYPAVCDGALAVGSVTLAGPNSLKHANYSNHYPQLALVAPGGSDVTSPAYNGAVFNNAPAPDQIFSTDWEFGSSGRGAIYHYHAGTSQAAPQVSALAALLLSKGVTQGPADTAQRMFDTATPLGPAAPDGSHPRNEFYGYGMINPAAALNAPATSASPFLQIKSEETGQLFQPSLNSEGQFTAYLGEGVHRVQYGLDLNGNGIIGELGEPVSEQVVELGPAQPQVTAPPIRPPELP